VHATHRGPGAAAGGGGGGLSGRRLAWLQVTHRRGPALALWLCLAAAVALPALLLVVGAMAAESGLAQTLDQAGGFSVREDVAGVDAFDSLDRLVDVRATTRAGDALVPLGAFVMIGPLRVLTLRTEPATGDLAGRQLTALYAQHLAAHVSVVAGELPPEGLAGGETAVSMRQADADRLGVHLSDRVCGDYGGGAGGQPAWCARIVGLWRPLAAGDPFWTGEPPGVELAMGRYDLFQLAGQGALRPSATIRYWAVRDATTPGGTAPLAAQVGALATELRMPQRRVDTRLDRSLLAFDAHERRVSGAIDALAALVAVLGLGAVGLAAARLLDGQRRELALLRARGWTRGRAWLVAFGGLGAVGATAAAAAVGGCLLAATAITASGMGLSALTLRPADVPGMLVALVAVAAALIVLLAALAARAVWRDPRPSPEPAGRPPGARLAAGTAAVAGSAALALPHLPDAGRAAGVALLAAAVALGLPVAWGARRASVPGTLAHLQLARRPVQHAGAAFVLTLAAAGALFAALGLAAGLASEAALWLGLDVGLTAGGAGGLLLALVVSTLHFRSAARRRQREYGGLLAHGLVPAQVGRSLAVERAVTAAVSLLAGCVLGAALALLVLA
jgi:hypothetical protein